MYDADLFNGLISNVLQTFILQVPTIIFLLGLALYRKWDLTLMILTLLPFLAYSTKKFGKRVKKKRKEGQRRMSFLTQIIGESILGARIIKVFNRETHRTDSFKSENQKYYREMMRVTRSKEGTKLVTDITMGVGVAFVMWYGGSLVVKEVITVGDFASIMVALYMIFPPVKKLGEAYNSLQETIAAMERVDKLFDVRHEEQGEVKIERFRDSIHFENVSFSYPGNESPVLNDIRLEIKHGDVIAIVGLSGVGKSTLVDLIPGFIKPSLGTVTIDGVNINDVELQSLRELIGIVSQDVLLFNDTVGENISFGRNNATESEVIDAARLAYADEFIGDLPDKYDTVIGEKGLRLSGGQRQRIAIARAILKNPPILILDEATSSLDSVSEAVVQKALEKLMKGRTTIVIAHRLSTIRKANKIIVLEGGRIIETGSHDELLKHEGRYQKLYELQFREQEMQVR
jgi:subfamily B ATP-binding cassette protein MsbA